MKKYIFLFFGAVFITVSFLYARDLFNVEQKAEGEKSSVAVSKETEIDPKIFELSLKKIFGKHQDISKLDKKDLVTVIMTGDIIPGRYVNVKVIGYGDFTHPYLKTADVLESADMTVANLEAPLMNSCKPTSEGMTFCGDTRHVQGLKYAGVDIVSLANNHSQNYGLEGITETRSLLKKNGISTVGLGKVAVKNIKGTKFGFLAYNGVTESFDMVQMESEIKSLRKKVDVLVVLPHWGGEYSHIPKTTAGIADDNPREVGKLLIDWGADIVLGNHPHWYQGVEIYKDKLIAYAHGNFVFDQEWSVETTQGVVGKYTFYKGKLVDVKYLPIQIEDYNQPHFLIPPESTKILRIMKQSSFE